MKTYTTAYNTPSDINKHLPKLRFFSEQCSHVTEIGLGATGNSVMAFIAGCKNVVSYDIEWHQQAINDATAYAKSLEHEWKFIQANSRKVEIEQTDFLFIDGEHSFQAVQDELFKHHTKVNKYIGFHDVVSYASRNENPNETGPNFVEGIIPAIFSFLQLYPEWKVAHYAYYNHGCLILEKQTI